MLRLYFSFDEVHFGKFASYYLRREYFFDVHPPLAKLLLAFQGWLIGYDGHFDFENIGDDYFENNVPYVGMRTLPAILGSLTPPVLYGVMRESGYPRIIGILTAMLLCFGADCVQPVFDSLALLTLISLSLSLACPPQTTRTSRRRD